MHTFKTKLTSKISKQNNFKLIILVSFDFANNYFFRSESWFISLDFHFQILCGHLWHFILLFNGFEVNKRKQRKQKFRLQYKIWLFCHNYWSNYMWFKLSRLLFSCTKIWVAPLKNSINPPLPKTITFAIRNVCVLRQFESEL